MTKSKRSRRRRAREVVDRSATTDVVSQLACAIKHPQATVIGAAIGGIVPWFARTLAHSEVPAMWSGNRTIALVMIGVILGCAVFSALTVYKFGRAAFGDPRKALGFVLALEGVMLVSQGTTSQVALIVLILINALSNGSVIAMARDAACKRSEADARRSATRARNRAAGVKANGTAAPTQDTWTMPEAPRARGTRARKAPVVIVMDASEESRPMRAGYPARDANNIIDAEIVSEDRLLS